MSEAKYRRLYESMRDACVTVTMDGRIVECNPAYQEMHGYTLDQLRAITYHDLTPAKWHATDATMIAKQVVPQGYSDVYEKEHYRRNGSVFPVELRWFCSKMSPESHAACGPSCATSAIASGPKRRLRKKEKEFRQAQKLEAVGALAGGMAHEFNNLLQAIRAFTQFALDGLLPEDPRYQDLQQVLKASERAANLTRQLLGFSRRQQFHSTNVRRLGARRHPRARRERPDRRSGAGLHPDGRSLDQGHVVRGRHEGQRQQHDHRRERVRPRASRPLGAQGHRQRVPHRAHRRRSCSAPRSSRC